MTNTITVGTVVAKVASGRTAQVSALDGTHAILYWPDKDEQTRVQLRRLQTRPSEWRIGDGAPAEKPTAADVLSAIGVSSEPAPAVATEPKPEPEPEPTQTAEPEPEPEVQTENEARAKVNLPPLVDRGEVITPTNVRYTPERIPLEPIALDDRTTATLETVAAAATGIAAALDKIATALTTLARIELRRANNPPAPSTNVPASWR